MTSLESIALNLVSAFVGFLASHGWRRLRRRIRYGRSRAFWEPFTDSSSTFAIGKMDPRVLVETSKDLIGEFVQDGKLEDLFARLVAHMNRQENSGLIGLGDIDAIMYINASLSRAGIPRISNIARADSLSLTNGSRVVSLGSDDVNPFCGNQLDLLGCAYRIEQRNGKNVVHDSLSGADYHGRAAPHDSGGSRTEVDYGILVRARLTQPKGAEILILAGAQGLGTLATARACFDRQGTLRHLAKEFPGGFECIVRYERIYDSHGEQYKDRVDITGFRGLAMHQNES